MILESIITQSRMASPKMKWKLTSYSWINIKPYGKNICKRAEQQQKKSGGGASSVREQKQQKETDETVKDTALGGREGGMKCRRKSKEDGFQGFVHRMSLSLCDSV